jgi:hypothetical protein
MTRDEAERRRWDFFNSLLALWRGLSVLPNESFNPALRVYELLFAGKERMTIRTDLGVDLRLGRPGLEFIPARTPHNGFHVFRVDSLLHRVLSFREPLRGKKAVRL